MNNGWLSLLRVIDEERMLLVFIASESKVQFENQMEIGTKTKTYAGPSSFPQTSLHMKNMEAFLKSSHFSLIAAFAKVDKKKSQTAHIHTLHF